MVDPGLAFRAREVKWAGLDRRQPTPAKGELHLARAQRRGRVARLDRLAPGLPVEALDERRDVRAPDADIGKRAVVERHQLAISALALPPPAPGVARRNEEIDQRHGRAPHPNGAVQKWGLRRYGPSKRSQSSHAQVRGTAGLLSKIIAMQQVSCRAV